MVVTVDSHPTGGLDGYTTYKFQVESDEPIYALTCDFSAPDINQVNPFGQPTIFQDNNVFITGTGGDPRHDSQFNFHVANDELIVVTTETSESLTSLRGSFGMTSPFRARNVAHVVIPDTDRGVWTIGVGYQDGSEEQQSGPFPIPEPTSVGLLAMGAWLAIVCWRRRRKT